MEYYPIAVYIASLGFCALNAFAILYFQQFRGSPKETLRNKENNTRSNKSKPEKEMVKILLLTQETRLKGLAAWHKSATTVIVREEIPGQLALLRDVQFRGGEGVGGGGQGTW